MERRASHLEPYWSKAIPNLVSYNRFVELMSYVLLALCCYFEYCCKGEMTGTSFIDSTKVSAKVRGIGDGGSFKLGFVWG
ncbi:hypothetical protein [Kamptonema animale]|jgi:hypothetical protein|uniref:hypothetical protein n=1 Tax=Kamptonema animale TaxID=92934 RepID=UPI003A8D1859